MKSAARLKFLLNILLSLFLLSVSSASTFAASTNSLKIDQFDAAYSGGRVRASANIKNTSNDRIRFSALVRIEKQGTAQKIGDSLVVSASKIIWVQDSQNFTTLAKDEEKKVSFDFFLSSHIPDGSYNVVLTTQSAFGEILGGVNIRRDLKGDGNFLEFGQEDCKVLKTTDGVEKSFEAFIAPPFDPSEKVKAVCTVKNTSTSPITAKEVFQTNVLRAFGFYLAKPQTTLGDEVTFAPSESKQITLQLPIETSPQVYESSLQFVDPSDVNNRFSNLVTLRRTIKGEAARIESAAVSSVKDGFFGKEIALKIGVYGAPDIFWNGVAFSGKSKFTSSTLNGALSVQIIGKSGAVCGSSQTSLDNISTDTVTVKNLPLSSGVCEEPTLTIKILDKDNKVLSSVDGVLIAGVQSVSLPAYTLILTALAAGAVVLVGFVVIKKRKK
jgi:hypothetical protein